MALFLLGERKPPESRFVNGDGERLVMRGDGEQPPLTQVVCAPTGVPAHASAIAGTPPLLCPLQCHLAVRIWPVLTMLCSAPLLPFRACRRKTGDAVGPEGITRSFSACC